MKLTFDLPDLQKALGELCSGKKVQSGEHIKALHQYCSTRLVVEGGFPPEWVNPTPPLRSKHVSNSVHELKFSREASSKHETRVLGGIKYKDVDVTVVVPGIGPALAVSAKTTGNAFRNLTNRMEEALGECTNVHLMYPGFVFGFLHMIRFNRLSDVAKPDASFTNSNEPLPAISRYHEVLVSLSGRSTITDPGMKYEAVGLLVYRCRGGKSEIWQGFPPSNSPVHFGRFFQKLYDMYDIRYAYPDPDGPNIRKEWKPLNFGVDAQFDRLMKFPWHLRAASDA